MTDGISTADSNIYYLFPELRSNVLDGPVLGLRHKEVNIDYEAKLDDHEDDKDVGLHDPLKYKNDNPDIMRYLIDCQT